MFVSALGTATPPQRYTKAQCWDAFVGSEWFERLDPRSHALTRAVLSRDNGIEARRLALDSLEESFRIDPDTLARRFIEHAPRLATEAAQQALARAAIVPDSIDAIVVSTCTGYLCPGLSGYVAERVGLRPDVRLFDLVGQGCAGALPNWQLAHALLDAAHADHVLSICVEVCSAAMYLDDDPGVLISACLFGDGAGAAVLSRQARSDRRRVQWRASASLVEPAQRDALMFESKHGMLRNVLTRAVPRLAAQAAERVLGQVLDRADLDQRDVNAWVMHAGGRDVLAALAERLALAPHALRHSAEILREYGNLSSAFVYFVLDRALRDERAGGWWWMSSFGAGFACHGALLEVDRERA